MAGMHPVLEQTRAVLARPLAGCSPEQVARHPGNDPASWSAWQVIDHLAATWRGTIRGLEDRLQKGRPLQSRPNLQQRLGQLAVCYLGGAGQRRSAHRAAHRHADGHGFLTRSSGVGFPQRADTDPFRARPALRLRMAPLSPRPRSPPRSADRTCPARPVAVSSRPAR
jgi:hypothetical protein